MYVVQSLAAASVFVLSIGGGMAIGLATGEQPADTSTPGGHSARQDPADDDKGSGRKPQDKGRSAEKPDGERSAYGQMLGDWKDCVRDAEDDAAAAECGPRPRPHGEARGWDLNGLAEGEKPGEDKRSEKDERRGDDKPDKGDRGRSGERPPGVAWGWASR